MDFSQETIGNWQLEHYSSPEMEYLLYMTSLSHNHCTKKILILVEHRYNVLNVKCKVAKESEKN
jgi:hypothetical protein